MHFHLITGVALVNPTVLYLQYRTCFWMHHQIKGLLVTSSNSVTQSSVDELSKKMWEPVWGMLSSRLNLCQGEICLSDLGVFLHEAGWDPGNQTGGLE